MPARESAARLSPFRESVTAAPVRVISLSAADVTFLGSRSPGPDYLHNIKASIDLIRCPVRRRLAEGCSAPFLTYSSATAAKFLSLNLTLARSCELQLKWYGDSSSIMAGHKLLSHSV